jgi:GTPase SAR1 family protein
MGIVIVDHKLTKDDIRVAKEEHETYIKITADIKQGVVIVGGQLHKDSEEILIRKFSSKNKNIWGGGYSISRDEFITDAILNIKPHYQNNSMEILDPERRKLFLNLAKKTLKNIKSLL